VPRAKALAAYEAEFKQSLAPHLQHILKPKRLLLLKEIVAAEGIQTRVCLKNCLLALN
jgi:hypothetical protein